MSISRLIYEEYEQKIAEIGERLIDDAQHNRINNREEWDEELADLLDDTFDELIMGAHKDCVENYVHSHYSFGFCDLCGEIIFYDDDSWYDLNCCEDWERERIEENLPALKARYNLADKDEIQDVCVGCMHDLLKEKGEA